MNAVCGVCGSVLFVVGEIPSADFYCAACKIAVRHPSYQIEQPAPTNQNAGNDPSVNEPTSATECHLL
jgi:hypothetical protein